MRPTANTRFYNTALSNLVLSLAFVMSLGYATPTVAHDSHHDAHAHHEKAADTVFLNGYIYTAEDDAAIAQSVATRDKKIIFVGSDQDGKNYIGPNTQIVDLNGKMMLPGFIDSHTHIELFGAANADSIDLVSVFTGPDYISSIRQFAESHPESPVIRGFNYSNVYLLTGGQKPTAAYLDTAVSDRPAAIIELSVHSVWVNTKALELLGITDATPNPPNGVIERDANGHATGQLLENAVSLVTNLFPKTEKQAYQDSFLKTVAFFNAHGVTGAFEAMNSTYGNIDTQKYYHDATEELAEQDKINMWLRGSWYINPADVDPKHPSLSLQSPTVQMDQAVANTKNYRHPNGLFRAETFKFFVDGIVEQGNQSSALMLRPYCQEIVESCTGVGTYKGLDFWANAGQSLVDALKHVDKTKFQIHMHTYGDGAVRKATDSIAQARLKHSRYPTMAHMQISEAEDLTRMAKLGITASLTLRWMELDNYFPAYYIPRYGFDRSQNLYDLKSMFDAGINVATGSDYAVSNPEYEIQTFTGLTRLLPKKMYDVWYGDPALYPYISDLGHVLTMDQFPTDFSAIPIAPLPPASERAKNLEDLIKSYTINTAKQLLLDKQTGSIKVGKSADMVVWDTNWFPYAQQFAVSNQASDLEPVANSSVLYTIFQGKIVYDAQHPVLP